MELRVYNQEDRLAVAAILIKNGYTVGQIKRKKGTSGKAVDYFLIVTEEEENADTAR